MNYSYILYSNKIKEIEKDINIISDKIRNHKRHLKVLEDERKRLTSEFLSINNRKIKDIDISHLLDNEME